MRIKHIIRALGGPTAVARRLEVRSQAVSLWVAGGQVPLERVPALLRMAEDLGVKVSATDLRGDYDWGVVCACREASA